MGRVASRWSAGPSGARLAAIALAGLACESAPVQEPVVSEEVPAPAAVEVPLDRLSADRAWADLEALSALGTPGGSADPAPARDYVLSALRPLGIEVSTLDIPDPDAGAEAPALTHVVATLPGASQDLFLLLAPLGEGAHASGDAGAVDENASGAALLLELARVLSTRSLPYTTRFVWLEAEREAGPRDAAADAGAPARTADALRGSRALAGLMAARGELPRVRLVVAFDRVCREDLRVARDLGSHRVHREEFFDAAARTGRQSTFARNQGFESVSAAHLAFRDAGVRAVAAIVGASTDLAPEPAAAARCSAGSFDAVGSVTLDALDAIGRRLAKLDRFSRAPLSGARASTPNIE